MNTSESQFNNVYDLAASRAIKERVGKTVPIKLDRTPISASEEAHLATVIREDK